MYEKCSIENCNKNAHSRTYCSTHYVRWWKYGDANYSKVEHHGMKNTKIYKVWTGMKERCNNLNSISYKWYGEKGIKVCDEWQNSFITFYNDMGNIPFKNAQLDRIDGNKNYSKDNCQWLTGTKNKQKSNATKLNWKLIEEIRQKYLTTKYSYNDLAKEYNVSKSNIASIITYRSWYE